MHAHARRARGAQQAPGQPGGIDERARWSSGPRRRGRWASRSGRAPARRRAARPAPRSLAGTRPPPPATAARAERVATVSWPVRSQPASISWRRSVPSIAAKFSRPSAVSRSSSSGKCARPLPTPCVSEASTKPPLRPLAAAPTRSPSSSTTSRAGSRCLASSAAQSPVKPPPTIARSACVAPSSGSSGSGASGESSQKAFGSASCHRSASQGPPPLGCLRAACRARGVGHRALAKSIVVMRPPRRCRRP